MRTFQWMEISRSQKIIDFYGFFIENQCFLVGWQTLTEKPWRCLSLCHVLNRYNFISKKIRAFWFPLIPGKVEWRQNKWVLSKGILSKKSTKVTRRKNDEGARHEKNQQTVVIDKLWSRFFPVNVESRNSLGSWKLNASSKDLLTTGNLGWTSQDWWRRINLKRLLSRLGWRQLRNFIDKSLGFRNQEHFRELKTSFSRTLIRD